MSRIADESLQPGAVTRLTVNIGPETAQALQYLMDRKGVTLTEALRRYVGVGYLLYRQNWLGKDILLAQDGETEVVTLL